MSYKSFFFFLVLALFLAACSGAEPVATEPAGTQPVIDSPLSFTDGLDRTITLPSPAQRVVSLAPNCTEILFAVGAGGQVVGRDMFSDYPPEAAAVQDIGGNYGEYDLEAILALQPDLVLACGINSPELVASLEELGLTVYFLPNMRGFEAMFDYLHAVGVMTGHVSEAASLVESLSTRLAAVDLAVTPITDIPSVYYELDATNPAAPYTGGLGSFISFQLRRAGGYNIASEVKGEWVAISLEQLLVLDPDVILLGDAAYGETPEKVAARPGWDALTAVKNGQIFPFDDNLVSRPGPRWVDALEALLEVLHPGVLK